MENKAYESNESIPTNGIAMNNVGATKHNGGLARVLSVDPEVEERREEQRNATPLRYCRWIANRPKTIFFITLGLAYAGMFATFAMMALGYDIIPIVLERLPLDIRDNDFYLRGLSWKYRDEDDDVYERFSDDLRQTPRSQLRESIYFLYEKEDGNVLTPDRLKAIQKNEDDFFNDKKFQSDFCHLVDGECGKPRSILQFFDGTLDWIDPEFNDTDFDNIERVLFLASNNSQTKRSLEFFLPIDAVIEETKAEASIIRSTISIGWPLKGYDSDEDEEDDQQLEVDEFLFEDFIDMGNKRFEDGVGGMNFYYNSFSIFQVFVVNQAYKDMALLGGSLIFIFLFMWFQTRSLFVTGFAVMSIITSFFWANILYRVVLDFRYFGFFHVLALFIILGIGADDVFVFFDTWRETAHYKFPSLAHRLSYAYRRAALAMLWTSLTTAVAFIVSATSPFLGVSSFGVFAGLLVFVNYMSVIIFLPCVIVLYHMYFEKFCCCCCCPNKTGPSDGEPLPETQKKNIVVRFFSTYYFRFITHKIIRWIIVLAFATLLAVFLYFATSIEVQEEQIEFLPTDTNFGGFASKIDKHFSTGEEPVRIHIVWGLEEQDVTGCHHSDSECFGDTVWDKKFSIEEYENQQALLEFCNMLKNLPQKQIDNLRIKRDAVTGDPEVYCFPALMKEFLEDEQAMGRPFRNPVTNITGPRYANGTELLYPVDENTAMAIMNNTDWIYDPRLEGGYNRWFEIGMSHWLHDGFQNLDHQPGIDEFKFKTYDPFLGVSKIDGVTKESTAKENGYLPFTYYFGTKLRYAAIVVNTTIKPTSLGFLDGIPIRDDWEDFVSKEIKKMPKGLQNGYQCTPIDYDDFDLWHWLDIQRTLVSSAVTGIVVGLCCALPVLIIATMNVVIGIMATINIALITATVVGFIPMMGWKLGFMESLNLVLVVGLAVDYCVHLAEGYSRSTHYDRKGRLHDALQEVGISVVSGCITTIGASAFMLFAVISFFTQFGSFLFATLGFSFIYSLGFFCTCLGLFGPQGDFGSLRVIFQKLCGCCCKKSDTAGISSGSKYSASNNAV